MTEQEVFEYLFKIAEQSKDPRGIVSACLVNEGKIVADRTSNDDGIYHAEYLLLKDIVKNKINFSDKAVLYVTLLPCNQRSNPLIKDCTSEIINSGIKNVVFGAQDPDHSEKTKYLLKKAGVIIRQVSNSDIVYRCASIFNQSVSKDQKGIKLKPLDL